MQTFPIEQYQIGIISALPKELSAVIAILDEEHEPPRIRDDHNSYVLGQIGEHKVVAACLPAGIYGTNSAASVSTHMLRTYSHLRFGLFVGIGGGIPNIPSGIDVRLGDVVVSQPTVSHGGVIQYDLGKKLSDGRFKRGRDLNRPPSTLLSALARLQSRRGFGKNSVSDHLKVIDRKYPNLKTLGYCYPGREKDHLHCAQCNPSRWWWILWLLVLFLWPFWRCQSCDGRKGRVHRPLRTSIDPVVHYGTIASGNTLLKNAQIRDQLKDDFQALCVEMEAAGVVDEFPCLVIRGICDYADAQKNDVWQEYAALTAAVFAKQLLEFIPPQSTMQERLVLDVVGRIEEHFQHQEVHNAEQKAHQQRQENFNQRQETRYEDGRHRDCHRVFKTTDYQGQKNINPNAVSGTCRWVLDHLQYQTWLSSTSKHGDLLWISADPGCGKSVLSRMLIDTFLRDEGGGSRSTICYYFFKDNEQQNSLATALCAIIHQLLIHQPDLIHHALPAFDQNGDKLQHDIHELWRIFQSAANDPKARPITCVLDALDECRDCDRAQLIDLLYQSYRGSHSDPSKWLVTSRPYDDITDCFNEVPSTVSTIRLRGETESDQIQAEINLVIRQRMVKLSQELHLSSKKSSEVLQQLLIMEHRTYLWLYLAIDAIKESFRSALRPSDEVVPLVPTSVEEAYEKILTRVSQSQSENAVAVLTIITGARRPLTIAEMALALDIATLPKPPKHIADLQINAKQFGNNIRQWCGLFVLISNDRLYLLHQTAKTFLLNHGNVSAQDRGAWKQCLPVLEVEKQLAMICVRFLCLSDFNCSGYDFNNEQNGESERPLKTFFNFAAQHWPSYVRSAEALLNKETRVAVQALYDTSSVRWMYWTTAMWQATVFKRSKFGLNHVQLAAFNGHNFFLQEFLREHPREIFTQDTRGRTSLIWAVGEGHVDVVQTLLQKGADVNARGGFYGNALQAASAKGYVDIVQALLNKGADTNARGGRHGGALHAAASQGHAYVARLLLENGADINARRGHGGGISALQMASAKGHIKIIEVLLEKGADVDANGFHGTALHAASFKGCVEAVQVLLDRGANINAHGGWYGGALHAAAAEGYIHLVRMLLDNGAEINAGEGREGFGPENTALQGASARGHDKVVRVLLERGANVNAWSSRHAPALQQASAKGHIEVVQALLEYGADVNACGFRHTPALLQSSVNGHIEVVRALLKNGANVDAHDLQYGTALQQASAKGHIEVMQALLDNGANVDAYDVQRGTALQQASVDGHIEEAQVLLEYGADTNVYSDRHSTALLQASFNGHIEAVRALLRNGANVNTCDANGNALLQASAAGRVQVVEILFDNGADIHACKDCSHHYSALELATLRGNLHVVQVLLQEGAKVTERALRCCKSQRMSEGHCKILVELLRKYHVSGAQPKKVGARTEPTNKTDVADSQCTGDQFASNSSQD